jgi:hypothetical protein
VPSTHLGHRPASNRGTWGAVLWLCALACVVPTIGLAAPTQVRTVDDAGAPLTAGSVVFCPLAADCLECPIAADGTIELDRTRLEQGTAYTIIVYSAQRAVLFATFEWVYDAAPFERAPSGKAVVPRLRGTKKQEVVLEFVPAEDVTPPPPKVTAPQKPEPAAVPDKKQPAPVPPKKKPTPVQAADGDRHVATPRLAFGVYVPFMLGGHFGVDRDALGGVTDVAPGFGVVAAWRFGYPPAGASGRQAVPFRELSLSYALNRYTVGEIVDPTRSSDLTFHRVNLALGIGRLTARTLLSGAVAIGYGGVYDGSERLEFRGRSYGMFGVGFQGRCGYRLLGGAAHGLGLLGQVDLMYYPADHGDDDHWYGFAPSLSAGVMVH